MKLLLPLACSAALLAAPVAEARKPVIAYVDDTTSKLKLYDAETGTDVAAPDLTIPKIGNVAPRFAMSHDGRYVAWVDNDTPKHIHLYDRESADEVQLPGIDVYLNPHRLTVSNTGLIGFDDNDAGPLRVYDSRSGAFVDTGLAADNEHSRPRLSGDGRFLASICELGTSKCAAPDDGEPDQDAFVQNLVSRTDTGFPDDISGESNRTETRPCIDADGSIVGGHVTIGADQDIYLYDRAASQVISPVALRSAAVKEVNCVLDGDGAYVGLGDFNGNFRVYERSSATFLNLPDGVETNEDYGLRWLTAPYPPPVSTPPPGGGGDPPPPDITAPLFQGPVTVTNRIFRVGAQTAGRRRARPRGTAFRYSLSEAAQLGIAIDRRATGRRAGRRCRPASRRLRKRPRCVRWLRRGTLAAPAVAGQNSTPFSGRIGRRALRPGRYRALLVATDGAGNRSAEQSVRFRVVRR